MSAYAKNNQYSRYYTDFAGVDLSSSPSNIQPYRFADMKNMYRDYYGSDGSAIETVPGFRRLHSFSSSSEQRKINSLLQFSPSFREGEYIAVHAGKRLFLYPLEYKDDENEQSISPEKLYKNGMLTEAAELADSKSVIFENDGELYILDGKNYMTLGADGVQDVRDIPYIPITYSDSAPYEQRNMLTDDFYCKFNLSLGIHSLNRYQYPSDDLIYSITGDGVCEVVGISDSTVTDLYVPSYTEINGKIYNVQGIAPLAFRGLTSLKAVTVLSGVKKIGDNAFLSCPSLVSVVLADTVEELGVGAFMMCSSLQYVTMGPQIKSIPRNAFYGTELSLIRYSGEANEWTSITKDSKNPEFDTISITYNNKDYSGSFRFYINEKCAELYSVKLDDTPLDTKEGSIYYTPTYEKINGQVLITSVIVTSSDYTQLYGKVLTLYGRAARMCSEQQGEQKPFFANASESCYDVISACTICVKFDGRLFYSGNPKYPSTVFYSARDSSGQSSPLYIGAQNYFYVGRGDSRITSILPSGNSILFFKDDSERGGIYIYEGADTESDLIPRIYTLSDYVGGVGSAGGACSFYGDTVFISERGLDAVSKKQLNGEISICHRSSNIDSALLKGSVKDCSICCWQGYLCILLDGEIFLADSRRTFLHNTGDTQYEWYKLSDIGTYEGQYSRFFTLPLIDYYSNLYIKYGDAYIPLEGREEFGGEDDCDGAFMTYAYKLEDGVFKEAGIRVFCCIIPDESGVFHCYMCDSSGEMKGGDYSPACEIISVNDVLFFGTASGNLCCFNTDKRDSSGNIDRRYYSFDGRRYFSGFSTKSDNCSIPNMTKSTVKHSLCLHLKSFGSGRVKVLVRTDQGSWKNIADAQNGLFAFDDVEFDRFTFNTSQRTTVVIPEKEKRWAEKQYHVYSDEYMRPFGIFDVSYRYKVAGRIKEK